ncbi:MAG: thiamine phosphate synthase, partial [Muribaculaceae bacterium]|nr:thiamine phosphate synthase [Muribaculaceae bacterium]
PNDVFLTIEHNVDLVEELKVHGVHLFPGDMLPKEARERLGAHAVVGVTVRNAEQVISLRSADIDYVQIGPYPDVTLDDYSKIVAAVQEAGVKIPVVATGNINPEDVKPLLATAVKGGGVSNPIALSGDIKEVVEMFLAV